MKLRKWSSLNKAEKLGRKRAFVASVVFAIIIFILLCFYVVVIATVANVGLIVALNVFFKGSSKIFTLILQFGFPICCYFLTKNYAINLAYDELKEDFSKKLAEKMLVRGEPTKVKLIKTRDGYYEDFLLNDLFGRVEYYAVLEENRNVIVIYTKFSDESEEDFFNDISNKKRKHFDFIRMEEFSSFCELL